MLPGKAPPCFPIQVVCGPDHGPTHYSDQTGLWCHLDWHMQNWNTDSDLHYTCRGISELTSHGRECMPHIVSLSRKMPNATSAFSPAEPQFARLVKCVSNFRISISNRMFLTMGIVAWGMVWFVKPGGKICSRS